MDAQDFSATSGCPQLFLAHSGRVVIFYGHHSPSINKEVNIDEICS